MVLSARRGLFSHVAFLLRWRARTYHLSLLRGAVASTRRTCSVVHEPGAARLCATQSHLPAPNVLSRGDHGSPVTAGI